MISYGESSSREGLSVELVVSVVPVVLLEPLSVSDPESVEDESSDSSVVDSMDSSLPMQPESEPSRKIMQSRIAR
jgi:hypothetical protein